MATFNEMVDEVNLHLSGYGMRNDALTHLAADLSNSSTSVSVDSVEAIGKGIIEIDDELLWVSNVDRTNSLLTIAPFGRGYLNTTATTHSENAMVSVNPTFSRFAIKKAINDSIRAVSPTLFAVGSTTFTYNTAVNTYTLPDNVQDVLAVSYQTIGSTKEWAPIRAWRIDAMANVSAFNSNNSITLGGYIDPGATVQVTYTCEPDVLESNSDDFSLTTGLSDSCKDVIILGAAYRLLSFVDPGRLNYVTPESDVQAGRIPSGSGTNVAKYVYALFQQRLREEADKLVKKYPVRVHYTN